MANLFINSIKSDNKWLSGMFIIIDKTDMILGTSVQPAQQAYLSTVWKNKQLLNIVQVIFGNKNYF